MNIVDADFNETQSMVTNLETLLDLVRDEQITSYAIVAVRRGGEIIDAQSAVFAQKAPLIGALFAKASMLSADITSRRLAEIIDEAPR